MSWQLNSRLTTVSQAVSIALLSSAGWVGLSLAAHAATMGKTTVQSAQNEPLSATITVSDIDVNNFSASLADNSLYQQLGLQPTSSMSVRFEPTSDSAGRVIISTSQPVSAPFADVVLSINDGGRQQVIPKTLLMPAKGTVTASNRASTSNNQNNNNTPNQTIATVRSKPNLPVTSATPANTRPVQSSNQAATTIANNNINNINRPITSGNQAGDIATNSAANKFPPTLTASQTVTVQSLDANRNSPSSTANSLNSSTNNNTVTSTSPYNRQNNNHNAASLAHTEANIVANTQANNNIDKQSDILNIQVIRKIRPKGASSHAAIPYSATNSSTDRFGQSNREPAGSLTTSVTNTEAGDKAPYSNSNNANTMTNTANPTAQAAGQHASNATYTVQRNDNLWLIANQLAEKNNVDVHTVMQHILEQNPDAFINRDADLLKANVQLTLPAYDVIPSQQSLQSAIQAQRQAQESSARSSSSGTKRSSGRSQPTQTARSTRSSQSSQRSSSTRTTVTKALPKARMSVLAPGNEGQADGMQTKAAAATGTGISTDILASLKSSRERTASKAERVLQINDQLASYTKKMQIQNQKLAELEANLKKLRQQ